MNINDFVKVKLTEYGKDILREKHENLRKRLPKMWEYSGPIVDEEGYTKFQMWDLMKTFGPYMQLGNPQIPFETEIKIS